MATYALAAPKKINLRRPDIMEAVQAQVLSHYRSELVERIRSVVPEATIVIFTGVQGLSGAALNVGADACIEKPAFDAVWPAIREARARR